MLSPGAANDGASFSWALIAAGNKPEEVGMTSYDLGHAMVGTTSWR